MTDFWEPNGLIVKGTIFQHKDISKDAPTKDRFKFQLRNRFQMLSNDPNQKVTLEDFNKDVRETGEKILGYKKREQKAWMKEATWDKIEEHRTMKQKMNS